MIQKTTDYKEIEAILKDNFNGYVVTSDPFEKVAIYSKKKISGIISYSIIYERGEINYIVATDKRKTIGSQLLQYALEDMEDNGCETVSLEVEQTNKPAINLYKKYGFKEVATRENYYNNKNGILMTKELR